MPRSQYKAIAMTCISVCVVVTISFEELFATSTVGGGRWVRLLLSLVIGIAVSLVLSSFLFDRIVKYYYSKTMLAHICGEWFQVFTVIDATDERDLGFRFGPCSINYDGSNISMQGTNIRADGSYSSSWTSEAVLISGSRISLVYNSEGARAPIRGIMTLQYEASRRQLVGTYRDGAPATRYGEFFICFDEEEQKRMIARESQRNAGALEGEPEGSDG